ncbi:MAG TPA: AAA family ATPase [Caulobacteraceae bacterium]
MSGEETWDAVAEWLARQSERTIETSCARVFLGRDLAWKIKRPVRLPFLDFSTLERRKWALDRELAFNRRWAPDIYRRVRAVTREGPGLTLDGPGEAIEWLLEMRRFDPDAVVANHPGALDGELAESLGRLIARGHIEAPAAPDDGGAASLSYTMATNEESLRHTASSFEPGAVERLIARSGAAHDALIPLLEARRQAGFGRACHGDMHLGNILLEDGHPIPFDCLEFNDRLSRIDVLYDLAFPVMDLVARGRTGIANRLLNAWLDEAARGLPETNWAGLACLPLFLAVRAAVRAHVNASTGEVGAAERYLAAGEGFLEPPARRLFAIGGLSGVGKTHFARILAPLIAGAPGAVILRSDEIRKRLAGAGALEPLPAGAYTPAEDARVHEEMFSLAATLLSAGRAVVLDATFLAPERRRQAGRLAAEIGVPFRPLWLEGEADLLRARLTGRGPDASDAGIAVLESQLIRDLGPLAWPRLSARADFAREAARLAGG